MESRPKLDEVETDWHPGQRPYDIVVRMCSPPADSVSEFIRTCVEDVVPIVTIKTFPNQKPWIDGSIRVKLKAQTTAFNQGKVTGNMTEYKQCSYSLCKAFKQAKLQYRDKVESQFNGSDTRGMWQGLQSITDYKKKTSPVTDQDVLLPGRLNTFFCPL